MSDLDTTECPCCCEERECLSDCTFAADAPEAADELGRRRRWRLEWESVIEENARLRAEIGEAGSPPPLGSWRQRAEAAEAKLAKAIEALDFYANDDNWSGPTGDEMVDDGCYFSVPAHVDRGARARAAKGE